MMDWVGLCVMHTAQEQGNKREEASASGEGTMHGWMRIAKFGSNGMNQARNRQ